MILIVSCPYEVKDNMREAAPATKKKKKTHKALANGLSEEDFKAGKIIVERLVRSLVLRPTHGQHQCS